MDARNKPYFTDRADAGRQLAGKMTRYQPEKTVVLAIPRGGVPVAAKAATLLGIPLDVVVTRKLPVPHNPEAGYGALAEDGSMYLNQPLVDQIGLTAQQISEHARDVLAEIKRRSSLYHEVIEPSDLSGKTAILIDDGLASGYTMVAAVKAVQKQEALKIVVASPVASGSAYDLLSPECDEMVCLVVSRSYPFAVAGFYLYWHDLTDKEVIDGLQSWRARGGK